MSAVPKGERLLPPKAVIDRTSLSKAFVHELTNRVRSPNPFGFLKTGPLVSDTYSLPWEGGAKCL